MCNIVELIFWYCCISEGHTDAKLISNGFVHAHTQTRMNLLNLMDLAILDVTLNTKQDARISQCSWAHQQQVPFLSTSVHPVQIRSSPLMTSGSSWLQLHGFKGKSSSWAKTSWRDWRGLLPNDLSQGRSWTLEIKKNITRQSHRITSFKDGQQEIAGSNFHDMVELEA